MLGRKTLFLLCFIVALSVASCPNGCGKFGRCELGVCHCFENHVGDDCSVYDEHIEQGHDYSQGVQYQEWKYFTLLSTSVTSITWTLSTGNVPGYCDLYINKEYYPSLTRYIAFNTTEGDKVTATVVNANPGKYIAGVFGKGQCSFHIRADYSSICRNKCHDHGICSNSECTCFSGYSGSECEEYDKDMDNHVAYFGYGGYEDWNYYHYKIQSKKFVTITVNRLSSSGVVNLFVRLGEKPSITTWDYSNMKAYPKLSVKIEDARPGEVFYIGVFTRDAAKYSVIVDETGFCPCIDENHGKCLDDESGICHCVAGFAGANCSVPVKKLKSGQYSYYQSVSFNEWNYYQIPMDNISAFVLTAEKIGKCDVPVFVSVGKYPTTDDYLLSDKNYLSDIRRIDYRSNEVLGGDVFVGVYGSPHNCPAGDKAAFTIECYVSKF